MLEIHEARNLNVTHTSYFHHIVQMVSHCLRFVEDCFLVKFSSLLKRLSEFLKQLLIVVFKKRYSDRRK